MIKKYGFYILLLSIYLLFLAKDSLFGLFNNQEKMNETFCQITNLNQKQELQNLRQLLDFDTKNETIIYSRITNRNIYEFYNFLEINKGSKQGIKKGDLVISEKGVIGLIKEVYHNYSTVLLLTNSELNLSVKVGSSYGILTSNKNKIVIKNIKLSESIQVGDKIVTSGLTNIPANFLIGEVTKIEKDSLELEYILHGSLVANIKEITYVGVVSS